MNSSTNTPSRITTQQMAEIFGVRQATIRHALCLHGHYLNVRPLKLPNRRLLWPFNEIQKVLDSAR